ncbi:MAG: hypothetical protein A4E26_02049 [Methanobacterium sp. PtaU1.Bin097]|jgi:hypothetical protein|nr:MAG: hypothetical protein A4E26_02049 [Methanobacterium sp. PtaU1.Bin097]
MGFFKLIHKGNGEGLKRLFIGGVHGKEGFTTINALKEITEKDVPDGCLVMYNCDESKYISTLNPLYYQSEAGQAVLYLIDHYKPDMYIELHCYKKENFDSLTDLDRKKKIGVPPLIELEEGVLIGSISPRIRTTRFTKKDICITLEIPCSPPPESMEVYVNFLKVLAGAKSREDLEKKATEIYPEQVETSQRYARIIFGDYPPF